MSTVPPKGILKNRTVNSSSVPDRNGQNDGTEGKGGFGYTATGVIAYDGGVRSSSLGSRWGTVSTSTSERSIGGVDFSNSLHFASGSDRGLLRSKMHEFVSRKRDMLFRPLGSDEIPVLERGVQGNTKDHFGVTPSVDFFLKSELAARRTHFFNTAQAGEIVVGELTSKTPSGFCFNLLSMESGRCLFLEELEITGYCPVSQMIPAIHPGNPNKIYAPGDLVRCEILSVKAEEEKVIVGMKGNALSIEMRHSAELGLTFQNEIPNPYRIGQNERKLKLERTYEELLDASLGFHNPNGVACLASQMGILNNRNTMMTGLRGVFPVSETAKFLRRQQNGKWAHGSVAEGIRHFKSGNLTEAFQCLNKALSIDDENVEGLVARGALYANKGGYEKAIDDFELALKYNPNHYNARKYLAETLVALGKQQEESVKIDEAVGSYGKCLGLRPDHEEAKNALWSIHSRYEKIDFTKLNPLQRGKIIDLREKVKNILSTDLTADVRGKAESDNGGKKTWRKSSCSSSSRSDSDSDDTKKKKDRKRKKKSKNEKDQSQQELSGQQIQPEPLSPFSRRLCEGGEGMIPCKTEKKEEWWGTSKHTPSTESDTKIRKKERRRKKRFSSSSSSSSSSPHSDNDKKSKTRRKKRASIEALGDLEAKLSAYFSKVEQQKIKEVAKPHPQQGALPTVHEIQRDLNFSIDYCPDTVERKEPIITRVLPGDSTSLPLKGRWAETQSAQEAIVSSSGTGNTQWQKTAGVSTSGKIELRTDSYGNFIDANSETIVRTIANPARKEDEKPRFEMKIRSQTQPLVTPAHQITDDVAETDPSGTGSKWRKIGDSTSNTKYTVTRLDGTVKTNEKPLPPFGSTPPSASPPQRTLYLPRPSNLAPAPAHPDTRKDHLERNYRLNSRSESSSRSKSRSPKERKKVRRSRSRSRRSRSNSRSRGRSRSWSPHRRFRGSARGRFARGSATERVERVRRVFLGAPPRGRRGRFHSRMRNVFARSRSRSRDHSPRSRRRSRSTSHSRLSIRKSHSPPKRKQTMRAENSKSPRKDSKPEKSKEEHSVEISLKSLTTTKASEVEKLLDQRKAEQKQAMKERNPEFFRRV